VALNVFFVAGFFYPHVMGHRHSPGRQDPVVAAARDFQLDDRQVQALEALRARVVARRDEGRVERDHFQTMIIDALTPPAFDRAALALALQQRHEGSGDMIIDMTEDLHGFLAGLSADQKAAFLERAKQRDFLRRLLFPSPPRKNGRDGPPPE
jgi:uncharacterized membrane protein